MGAVLITSLSSPIVSAKGVYQSGPDFITQVFAPQIAEPAVLWLSADIRQQAQNILGRKVAGLRVRYHRSGTKTAWILEEVGKEMPITKGGPKMNYGSPMDMYGDKKASMAKKYKSDAQRKAVHASKAEKK